MTNDGKKAFTDLLETYISLGESVDTIVRQLKKMSNPDARRKIVQELRSLDKKRLEVLDQMESLER